MSTSETSGTDIMFCGDGWIANGPQTRSTRMEIDSWQPK
jgi:hypothetical protein